MVLQPISRNYGGAMYTSSFKSPCKKGLLTSSWYKLQPFLTAKEINVLTVVILTIGENVKSTPVYCLYP